MYSFYHVATGFKMLIVFFFFSLAILEITGMGTTSLSCSPRVRVRGG